MQLSRAFPRLDPGIAAVALLIATAAPALAIDPPKGSLRSREFSLTELAVSSSHVPLDDVLAQLPNRGAWERFRGEWASAGADRVHVYIDPRSGAASAIIAPFPLLPGDGVGNRVGLADLAARLGRPVDGVDAAVVAEAARRFVVEHADVLGIAARQVGPLRATEVSDTLWQISAPQVVAGITVRDARLALTISHGNVVAFGTEGWGRVRLRRRAAMAAEKAMAAAFAYAGGRLDRDIVMQAPAFEIVATAPAGTRADEPYAGPVGRGYVHRLVYSTTFKRPPEEGRWETLVDASSGEVIAFRDKNQYENQQVTGGVYPLTNTGQCSIVQACGEMQSSWPMPFADTGLPAPNNVTNSAGIYDFSGAPITTTLTGPFVDIVDTCGPINASSETGGLDLGGLNGQHDCVIGDGGGPGNTPASRSAFYELNKLAEQARGWLPGNTWLQSRLTANVNILQTCNAFWNGTSVNFFRSGGGCGNTGEIAAVFDHEWGHGLDDNDANGAISNSSEGYADIAAIYRLQASCVGHGFFVTNNRGCGPTADGTGFNQNENQVGGLHCDLECSGVRDADWDKHADHTPDTALGYVCTQCGTGTGPCGRQVHCAAAPSRQAAWDLVTRDLTGPPFNLDSQSAFLVGNKIFYQGSGNIGAWHACTCNVSSSGCGATNAYIQWLTADDDNGNLNDGTPHMTALFAAFDRHGIACATPAPVNSGCAETPAAPALTANPGTYSARLDWSASEGAGTYWVMRSEGHAGCDFGKAKIAEVTGRTFIDTEVAPGRSYAYNVVARGVSPACYSPVSNCVEVTPTASTDPDFSVACNPSSLSVVQGNTATTTCTVASANGFGAEVALSCAGLPADATCSFTPPAVTPDPSGPATSTLTVSTASATPAGLAAVQVLGTSGALSHAANLKLTVRGRTFSVACVPSSLSVIQGNSATSACTLTAQNDFSGEVALSCGSLPAGASCGFSPATVTLSANGTAASALTLSTLTTTPGGATAIQVTGTSGALTRSTGLALTVQVPDFFVNCSPPALNVIQGGSAGSICTVTSQNGFRSPVNLACANLPAGAACSFDLTPVVPPPGGAVSSTLTVSTSATTPGGFFTFQVVGSSVTVTRNATVFLQVQVPDFAWSCTPSSLSVPQGTSVTSTCRVTSGNTFSAPVSLACGTLPAGAACSFSPAQVTPPSNGFVESTLTVTTSAATPQGTASFQAVAVGGGLTKSFNMSLGVTAPPDYTVTCSPTTLSSSPGGAAVSGTCTVRSLRSFNAPVNLACAGLPAGATCTLTPRAVTPAANGAVSSALRITTAAGVPTGAYPFTVTGTSGALTRSAALTLVLTRTVYFDNFETATGWVTNPAGTDTATRGRWERATPVQYTGGNIIIQNGTAPSGVNVLVTGASTSGSNGDIDGGQTSIQSPPIALPSGVPTLTFAFYFSHRNDSSPDDFFRASIVGPSGTTTVFQELGTAVNDSAAYTTRTIDLSAFAGQTIRILFAAGDFATDQLLEAAVDDVRIVVQ